MSQQQQPLLVIVGITGVQGRSVTSHYQTHLPHIPLRGLSRKPFPSSPIPIVQADLLSPSTLSSALASATHIFAYTDFAGFAYSPAAAELVSSGQASDLNVAAGILERRAGKNLADAAAEIPTLQRLVWSTTQNAEEWSQGEITNVQEMQAKAEIWEYLKAKPGLEGKVSAVQFGVFLDVLVRFPEAFGWGKTPDGKYGFDRVPVGGDSKLGWIDMPNDAGKFVQAVMEGPAGMMVEAVTGYLSWREAADIIGAKLRVEVGVKSVGVEEYAKGDETGLERGIALLFKWVEKFGIAGGDERFLTVEELAQRGYRVKRSDVRESLERMDWSKLLQK